MRLRWIIFALLLPLVCGAVQPYTPQIADPAIEPWRWRIEKAVNDLGVICMDDAPNGTLWFGCSGKIASYDGRSVQTIPFDDELLSRITHSKLTPWASAILALSDDQLLVLIGESLVLRSGNEWRVILADVGPSFFTSKLEQAADGSIWLLVPRGLWRIQPDVKSSTEVIKTPQATTLESLTMDKDGTVWVVEKVIGGQTKLVRIPATGKGQDDRLERFVTPCHIESAPSVILACDDGSLMYAVGFHSQGLYRYIPQENQWIPVREKKDVAGYGSLLQIKDGSVFLGGASGQLGRYTSDGQLIQYERFMFDFPNVELSLFLTSCDRLWVIGRIGHVYSLDLSFSEWLSYKELQYGCETADGLLWFYDNTLNTVVSFNEKANAWMQYDASDGMIERVHLLFATSQGLVLAVGQHEGRAALAAFDGKKWVRYAYPQFAGSLLKGSVYETSDGMIWLGAQGAELRGKKPYGGALQLKVREDLSLEVVKHFAPPEFPYYVFSFCQTPDNRLWMGSTLVFSYDRSSAAFQYSHELGGERVVEMAMDQQGALWLAKESFGVCRREKGSWTVYDREAGLTDLLFSDLICLHDGSILLSSDKSISRFDGTSWSVDAYPEWFRMTSRWSAINQSSDGSIWFSYKRADAPWSKQDSQALRVACAIRHRPESNPPETVILNHQDQIAQPGNVFLSWEGNDIWHNTAADDLQFSWFLDQGSWSPFTRETSHSFLNVSSGKHVFEVKARDRFFNVDPTPVRVEFTVIPPLWKQPRFLAMIFSFVGIICGLLVLLVRSREKNLIERQKEHELRLIAEQQRKEQQQQEKERHLQEIDRLKMGFFTNISHELRTPMTVVSGRIQMLLKNENDPTRKRSLEIVERSAHRVSLLVTQLLDFRKIEEGRMQVQLTRGDLATSLREWMDGLQVLAERKNIQCSLVAMEQLSGLFDFDKLYKIFTNLISNSIKYTPDDGKILVRLSEGERENGEKIVRFVVEDNGIGISSEHLPHIFERFYRVPEASMAVGAGIGLNLAKELVDLMGGEICVQSPIYTSEDNPGTRFVVWLPMTAEGATLIGQPDRRVEGLQDAASTVNKDSTRLRFAAGDADLAVPLAAPREDAPLVLVVEDDADIRTFIQEGLSPLYRVEVAEDGQAGVEKACNLVPDLIVTDLMMPVMGGMELCRSLRANMATSHIPVVMLTAKTALESQLEGLRTGVDDYITKPFHMELLQTRLANLLESRRLLRERVCREYSMLLPAVPEDTLEKEFLTKLSNALKESFSDEFFTPDVLADTLHMSLRSLHRKLKAVTGHTPSAYINEYRILHAAELLKMTSYSVTEITFQVGFNELASFSRMFKQHFGVSPSQYRSDHGPR
ncbi:MAG: helix-turn-helix domain-containing protein [Kiritimatiellaceae bacterium]|nr:helix-turn-helix domain-containing protein [Kiritimatiellaceae bacterium]